MKLTEARELLELVSGYDRKPVTPATVDVWFEVLRGTDYDCAVEAVRSHFRTSAVDPRTGQLRAILPDEVRKAADVLRAARVRVLAQRALAAAAEPKPGERGGPQTERGRAAAAAARAAAAAASAKHRQRMLVTAA